MSELLPLTCTALAVTADQLDIEIKNTSGAALEAKLWLEIQFRATLVDARLREAAIAARSSESPKNMVSLASLVTVGGGLSVWAYINPSDDIVAVRIYNFRDQKTGDTAPPVKIEAGAALTLRVPLSKQGGSAEVTIPYICTVGSKGSKGSFTVTPIDAGEWTPKVTLRLSAETPTSLEPATKVKIEWEIKDGISATLRGPLPGGHSQMTLSRDPDAPYKLAAGSLEIYAVGQATYILDAEVRRPRRQPNMQVVRTLLIDTKTVAKYAYLNVRPSPILPNGQVKIDWAVWGVEKATISIGKLKSLQLTLTEQDLSGTYQGAGTWSEQAPGKDQTVYLRIPKFKEETAGIVVAEWLKIASPAYTGRPLGLAVAGLDEKEMTVPMALLTSDGLYMASIGRDDSQGSTYVPTFSKVSTDTPKAWLALTAFEKGFVVLRQIQRDRDINGLQLVRYNRDKTQMGPPVDLPEYVSMLLSQPGAVFNLAAFGKRVYIIIELHLPGGSMRQALSMRFEPSPNEQYELELQQLRGYRLLSFAGALYAVHRASGHLYRFDPPDSDEQTLDPPRKAKSAAHYAQSLLRQGLLIPVGNTLVVLGTDETSPFRTSDLSGMVNVANFFIKIEEPKKGEDSPPQDLVYNPQKDEWSPCGQGLQIKPGAVAAYRAGRSPRLWVLQPDGELYTLTGAEEELFAPDHVDNFPPATLPFALNAKRTFQIKNSSGMNLVLMDNAPIFFGLEAVSAVGYVDFREMPWQLPRNATERVEIAYHETDPAPIKLRFRVQTTSSAVIYFVEVTFSGSGLSSVSSVFKRAADDKAGVITIEEVPGTRVQHPADSPIIIPPPKRLAEKAKLVICNATPYDLLRDYPQLPIPSKWEVPIAYDTPSFTLYPVQGFAYAQMGTLHFDINFALPDGIEILSKGMGQRTHLRINPDDSSGMEASFIKMLKPGDAPVEVEYVGGTGKTTVSASSDGPVYICQISQKFKKELAAVYVGDGTVNAKGDMYIPLADPANVSSKEVWRLDTNSFDRSFRATFSGGGVFTPPNSIGVWRDRVYALLGDSYVITDMDSFLNKNASAKRDFSDHTSVTNLAVSSDGTIYVLGIKKQGNPLSPQNIKAHYWLTSEDIQSKSRRTQICLDDLRNSRGQTTAWEFPGWVNPSTISPLAISNGDRRAAIGIEGGVMVIDLREEKVKIGSVERERIEIVALDGTEREEAVVFANTFPPSYLYCAHSQPGNRGGLKISRVNVKTMNDVKEKLTITLAPGEGNYDLVTDTSGRGNTAVPVKRPRAISMVITSDNKNLFVSHGRTIMQLDAKAMKVVRSFTVELPCRVFHAIQEGQIVTVYAIGATYKGNGNNVEGHKMQLYKLAVLMDS